MSTRVSPRPLLTVFEVARILSVSAETVRRMEHAGRLRGIRLSRGSLRFDPADVERLIKGSGK
jgi:excisionase family DNA binding protein